MSDVFYDYFTKMLKITATTYGFTESDDNRFKFLDKVGKLGEI